MGPVFPVENQGLREVAQGRAALSCEAEVQPEAWFQNLRASLLHQGHTAVRSFIHSFIQSFIHSAVIWYLSGPGPDPDTL